MPVRFLVRVLAFTLGLFVFAAGNSRAEPSGIDELPLVPGERPPDAILDPSGILSDEVRQDLGRQLATVRAAGGLDVMVVLLPGTGGIEPREMALDLANRWGDASGRAVVLHVEGWSESPWIAISGRIVEEIPPRVLESIRAKAEKRARSGGRIVDQLREAVSTLTDDIRFLRASLRGGSVVEVEKKVPYSLKDTVFLIARKVPWIALGLVALLGLVVVAAMFLRSFRRRIDIARPLEFPELSCKRRMGAPHGAAVYSPRGSSWTSEASVAQSQTDPDPR